MGILSGTRRLGVLALLSGAGCSLLVGTGELSTDDPADAAIEATADADGTPPDGRTDGEDPLVTDGASEYVADAGAAYVLAVLEDGPTLYYRLEETSGAVINDETGKHPGTLFDGPELGVPGAFPGSAAIRFTGVGAIKLGDALGAEGRKHFTLEAWFRPDVYDGVYRFLFAYEKWNDAGRQSNTLFAHSSYGVGAERYVNGAGLYVATNPAPVVGVWTHVVLVYDGDGLRLYLDGVQVAFKGDGRAPADEEASIFIGAQNSTSGALRGSLDEVAVYDKALSAARISIHAKAR